MTARLLIGVLSCDKYRRKADAIRQTWLRDCRGFGVKALFLIGRPGRRPEISGDKLYLDCGDSYLDLPYKTAAFLKYAHKNLDFDYIFKCDDDTYVDIKTLLNLPYAMYEYFGLPVPGNAFPRDHHYKHVEARQRHPHMGKARGEFMFGGSGYFLSSKAVELVIGQYEKYMPEEIYEDKLVGDILHDNNIRGCASDMMTPWGSFGDFFLKSWRGPRDVRFATFHPCSAREIAWIHRRENKIAYFLLWARFNLPKTINMRSIGRRILPKRIKNALRYAIRKDHSLIYFDLILDIAHCNLSCMMCPRGGISGLENKRRGLMSFRMFRDIVNKFRRENAGIKFLEFGNWGESLLNPELPNMIRYAKSRTGLIKDSALININTNLTVLPDPEALLESGVNLIQVSVSGMTQAVYARNHTGGDIETVLKNILRLTAVKNKKRLNVTLKLVFHDYIYNRADAETARRFCRDNGIVFDHRRAYIPSLEDNIRFHAERRRFSEFYSQFIDLEKELALMRTLDPAEVENCCARYNRVTVNFDASLYRCCTVFEEKNLMGSFFKFRIGDIPKMRSAICEECARTPVSNRPPAVPPVCQEGKAYASG
ncbi:MAG: radical SAM protein [Candidatus Omnitrophica bacterium]|nr:radical SAM protein [Candidatus Omnitrophota bacterium]